MARVGQSRKGGGESKVAIIIMKGFEADIGSVNGRVVPRLL